MNKIFILTGPAGVGKSTISRSVAQILEKSVLIEGDDIYNQFVGGRIKPWMDNAPLDLFWNNCITLIKNYLNNGYDVVFNYIIGIDKFNELKEIFKYNGLKFVLLMASEDEIIKRDKKRPLDCQMGERSLVLLKEFKNYNYEEKYILDTTSLSIENTIKEIIESDRFYVL